MKLPSEENVEDNLDGKGCSRGHGEDDDGITTDDGDNKAKESDKGDNKAKESDKGSARAIKALPERSVLSQLLAHLGSLSKKVSPQMCNLVQDSLAPPLSLL
jgi:hypothetical protein